MDAGTEHEWEKARTEGPAASTVETCRLCGAESVDFREGKWRPGEGTRRLWGAEPDPLKTMPECPRTCGETAALLTHSE